MDKLTVLELVHRPNKNHKSRSTIRTLVGIVVDRTDPNMTSKLPRLRAICKLGENRESRDSPHTLLIPRILQVEWQRRVGV